MAESKLKVDPKFRGAVIERDCIWICDECGKTYAGGKTWVVNDICMNKKYLCGQCVKNRISSFQKGLDSLIDKMSKDN